MSTTYKIFYYGGKLHKRNYTSDGLTFIKQTQEVALNPTTTLITSEDSILIIDNQNSMTLMSPLNLYYGDPNVSSSYVQLSTPSELNIKIRELRDGMLETHSHTTTGAKPPTMEQYNSMRVKWFPANGETVNLTFTAMGATHVLSPAETIPLVISYAGKSFNDFDILTIPSGTLFVELGLNGTFQ